MISGGEAFRILSTLCFERAVHMMCRAAFYGGIGLGASR